MWTYCERAIACSIRPGGGYYVQAAVEKEAKGLPLGKTSRRVLDEK